MFNAGVAQPYNATIFALRCIDLVASFRNGVPSLSTYLVLWLEFKVIGMLPATKTSSLNISSH